jgi:hypothetical protein
MRTCFPGSNKPWKTVGTSRKQNYRKKSWFASRQKESHFASELKSPVLAIPSPWGEG